MPSCEVRGAGSVGTKGYKSLTSLRVLAMRWWRSCVDSAIVKERESLLE